VKYYSNVALYRQERTCTMRSKKSAVRYGLLTVMLVSLSLASTSSAWPIFRPKVEAPEYSWAIDWWSGGIVIWLECDSPGATTHYTWATGKGATASNPTSFSRRYTIPLLVTIEGQLRARAFKSGWEPSDILIIDFYYN